MIIFKSHSTHSRTKEKVITSNHYNLTGSLCEKHVIQLGIEPLADRALRWMDM